MNKLIPFKSSTENIAIPDSLNDPFEVSKAIHPLCLLAVEQLQEHLTELNQQSDFQHNFGLEPGQSGKAIGKMFGVLVVQSSNGEMGFLCAFSGKLANTNMHAYFVPPIFDSLSEDAFLNQGMRELKVISEKMNQLAFEDDQSEEIQRLQQQRKEHSQKLQNQLFESYHFKNVTGEEKTAKQLFPSPPAGAGECSAPKLFQYAFNHNLRPLAIAEFWWGVPPSMGNTDREHKHFYPACEDKCRTILSWMLA